MQTHIRQYELNDSLKSLSETPFSFRIGAIFNNKAHVLNSKDVFRKRFVFGFYQNEWQKVQHGVGHHGLHIRPCHFPALAIRMEQLLARPMAYRLDHRFTKH